MRGIVVDNQMQLFVRIGLPVDLFKKLQPFLVPMPRHAVSNDGPIEDVVCRKQRRRAVAFIVVRHGFTVPPHQRKAFLRSVESLYLALLIHAQHSRVFRGIRIQAHHIDDFFGEVRIVANLESSGQMRFEIGFFPNPSHARVAKVQMPGQRTRSPMSGVFGLGGGSGVDDDLCQSSAFVAATISARTVVRDTCDAPGGKTPASASDFIGRNLQRFRNVFVLHSVRRAQNDRGSQNQTHLRPAPPDPSFKSGPLIRGQYNFRSYAHRFFSLVGD